MADITKTQAIPAPFIEGLGKTFAEGLTKTVGQPIDTTKFQPTVAYQGALGQAGIKFAIGFSVFTIRDYRRQSMMVHFRIDPIRACVRG